jgi:hypothetical protein
MIYKFIYLKELICIKETIYFEFQKRFLNKEKKIIYIFLTWFCKAFIYYF